MVGERVGGGGGGGREGSGGGSERWDREVKREGEVYGDSPSSFLPSTEDVQGYEGEGEGWEMLLKGGGGSRK